MHHTHVKAVLCACALLPLLWFSHPLTAQTDAGILGARRYLQFCGACHGSDGQGGPKGPSLVTSDRTKTSSDEDLVQIIHDGTPEGMPPFAQIGDANIRVLVRFLRVLEGGSANIDPAAQTAPRGDPDAGRALFFGKAQCAGCHTIQGKGGFIASDLTAYGTSHAPAVILRAITQPDTPLAPNSRVVTVTTRNAQTLTGVLRNEDGFTLDLQTQDGHYHLLDRGEIANVRYSDHSLMPRDYSERLSTSELDDIVAFLREAGDGMRVAAHGDR